jgi:hypothetical protein
MNALTAGKYKNNGGTQDPVQCPSNYETDMSGVIDLADAISDMGTMTGLSLASNGLGIEGAKIIAAILPKCT